MFFSNKTIIQKREVATAVGQQLAVKFKTGFIETSAKSNENITE